jgi:hypothetical protein
MTRVRDQDKAHLARIEQMLLELEQHHAEFVRMKQRLREQAAAARAALESSHARSAAPRQTTPARKRPRSRPRGKPPIRPS